jgi:hypothetical protein
LGECHSFYGQSSDQTENAMTQDLSQIEKVIYTAKAHRGCSSGMSATAGKTNGRLGPAFCTRKTLSKEYPMNTEKSFSTSNYADQVNVAERELSAFIRAVTQLFGPEEARVAAEDWLDESESMDSPPRSTSADWRAVTVTAAARLANRRNPALHHRTAIVVSTGTKVSPIPSSNCFASTLLV